LLQKELSIEFLGELDSETFEQYQALIGDPTLIKRARHAVTENERTLLAKQALVVLAHKPLRYLTQCQLLRNLLLANDVRHLIISQNQALIGDPTLIKRARHAVTENERTLLAKQALTEGLAHKPLRYLTQCQLLRNLLLANDVRHLIISQILPNPLQLALVLPIKFVHFHWH
jgi:galactokinase